MLAEAQILPCWLSAGSVTFSRCIKKQIESLGSAYSANYLTSIGLQTQVFCCSRGYLQELIILNKGQLEEKLHYSKTKFKLKVGETLKMPDCGLNIFENIEWC